LTHPIAITSQSQGILDNPICCPLKVVLTPFLWIIHKIKRVVQIFLGHLLSLGVFPYGKMNKSWISRQLIQLYQGGCYDTHERNQLNLKRLADALSILENMGGIRSNTRTKDGVKLDSMIIRYQDVLREIEKHGGTIKSCLPIHINDVKKTGKETICICQENHASPKEYVDIILKDETKSDSDWDSFCEKNLSRLGLEKAKLTLAGGRFVEGYIVKHWNESNPTRPKEGQCFVRCNAPTESYPMSKRDIFRHVLAMRSDMLCFDFRSSGESEGTPTEGGCYADAEAMVEKAVHEYGYKWKDIWAEGFCEGAAIALHLKKKYHDKGINVFTQNGFDCMNNTLRQQIFPADRLAPWVSNELKSRDPKVQSLVFEDCFDSVGKLQSLTKSQEPKKGVSIIVNTDTDTTVHPDSHARLKAAAEKVSEKCFSHFFNHPIKGKNGHSYDVLGERSVWDKVVTYITHKDFPQVVLPAYA